MRLPYAPASPPPSAPPSTQEIYTRIAARRAPRPLLALDRALLHSPAVADGWNSFLGAVRSGTSLPGAGVQEVAISRVAVLTGAVYEWEAHSALALPGVGEEGLRSLRAEREFLGEEVGARLEEVKREGTRGGLSYRQWVVVAYADQMTRSVTVDDGVWERVREEFGDTGSVELTATVAAYNCVSRFLVALDVGERNGKEMEVPRK